MIRIKVSIKVLLALLVLMTLFLPLVQAGNCLYYFYGAGCTECEDATRVVEKLQDKYPTADIQSLEVYYEPKNGELLRSHYSAHRVALEEQGIPAVFFANTYLIGGEPIQNFAEEHLIDSEECPSVIPSNSVGITGNHRSLNVFENISFSEITAGALLDAFHPGMWAVLLLLLLFLAPLDRSVAVRNGVAFIGGVVAAYFLFAYGYFRWFAISGASVFFYRAVGLVAILYGLLVWKNFLWKWRLFHWNEGQKWMLTTFLQAFRSLPGMILLGLLAGLFSLQGVSATLLSMRLAFQGETSWTAVPVLLYYLLVVVIPLVVVLIIYHLVQHALDESAQRKDEKTDAWREHLRKMMHIFLSLAVLLLGFVVLFM